MNTLVPMDITAALEVADWDSSKIEMCDCREILPVINTALKILAFHYRRAGAALNSLK